MILHGRSWKRWAVMVALAGVVGCAQDAPQVPINDGTAVELPVIQVVLGEFDGHDFQFRTLQPGESVEIGDVGRGTSQLVDLASYGCTGAACTGDDYVAFSNVANTRRVVVNGGQQGSEVIWTSADALNCGSPPSTGVCQGIRMRNLYTTQLERVYASLTTLTPSGSTTEVSVPFQPWGASADFGVAPTIANAMWRAGTIGRNSPETGGVTQFWSFTGTTPPSTNFTFRFIVQVRGQIVHGTRRATVVGADDPTLDYPALTSGSVVNANIDITPDGRYVVFASTDATLTGQAGQYIVRHDMETGENLVVNMLDGGANVVSGCTSNNPSISADGNRVAFQNQGCQLASLGGVGGNWHVYVRDIAAQTTTLVSVNTSGGYANRASEFPRISDDGNVVVFHSSSGNLVPNYPASGGGRSNPCREVFRRDLAAGTTVHVSAIDGTPVNAASGYVPTCTSLATAAGREPDLNQDGSVVVFRSAQPLDPSDSNADLDIYVYRHNGATADVYRVSLSNAGAQIASPTGFDHAAISPDGNVVAFSSEAAGIIGAGNGSRHVYRRSSTRGANGTISRVTVTAAGVLGSGGTGGSPYPALSHTGRFVAFFSTFTNLATPFASGTGQNFYVCDTQATTADLRRCFVANRVELTPGAGFTRLAGSTGNAGRPAMACPNENEACYVAYIKGGSTVLANGSNQVWVSPVGDPRDQMPAPSR